MMPPTSAYAAGERARRRITGLRMFIRYIRCHIWYDASMPEQRFDAVVIGAGPGGYPAAIRLGQLKVKTCIIEREYMGGVCLNVGCIPSKAVIHASKMFDKMSHADDLGIMVAKPTLDMKKLQGWKSGVVSKLTGGVRTLLKGNGVEVIDGTAKL